MHKDDFLIAATMISAATVGVYLHDLINYAVKIAF